MFPHEINDLLFINLKLIMNCFKWCPVFPSHFYNPVDMFHFQFHESKKLYFMSYSTLAFSNLAKYALFSLKVLLFLKWM